MTHEQTSALQPLFDKNLCIYDIKNPNFCQDTDDEMMARNNCACDNCFYGRDRLALIGNELLSVLEYARPFIQGLSEEIGEGKDALDKIDAVLAKVRNGGLS